MRKCSVIIPLSAGAQVSASFVIDLNEALSQMRGRQLLDVCITFPAGYSTLLEPFRKLCEGSNPVHYQLAPDASVVSCLNKGLSHAVEKMCDALVVIPGSIIAPETLSSLCSTGNSADNFGIISARVYRNRDESGDGEQEALYFSFLQQSKNLYEWQETRLPSPFCFFLSFQLLRERPTLSTNYEYLDEALHNYSEIVYSLGFRTLLHNQSFHTFPQSAGEYLYILPSSPDTPPHYSDENAISNIMQGVIPDHVVREHLGALTKNLTDSRPSLVVDLRALPHYANPSFDLGIHVAAAAHSRLSWTTTLLVPSIQIAEMWGLTEKFPKAELLTGDPKRCYDYALYPTYPESLGDLASFVALSPNSFFLLQEPFGRNQPNKPQNDAFSRIIASIAQGIFLIGSSGESRFRANLSHRVLPPLHSLLPSQYSKDYSRTYSDSFNRESSRALICLPENTPDYLLPVLEQIQSKLVPTKIKLLGSCTINAENVESIHYNELQCEKVYSEIGSALFVVFPCLTEDLLLYLARALSFGKIVIAIENELVHEIKERWHGPRNIVIVPMTEELPSIVHSLTDEAERMRFIATYSSDRVSQNNCRRWPQIGSAVNEFIVSTSNRTPVAPEEFIRKQSLLSDLIHSTFHLYSQKISAAEKRFSESQDRIQELEDRIKKLEAAQVLLASSTEPERRSTFLEAFSNFQGWGTRSKEKGK